MGDVGGLKNVDLDGELKVRSIVPIEVFFASHSSSIPPSSSVCCCPFCKQPVNSRDYGKEVWNNAKKH